MNILQTDTKDLTKGPLGKQLVALTFPMIFGSLGMMIFNVVDTFFVGQLGTKQLAAISFTFPVVMVIMSISIGLGTGATSLISRAIGEKDHYKVKDLTSQSLLLSIIVVAVATALGLLTINPVFKLLGASDELLGMVKDYMNIWYPGMIAVVVTMVGNNAIRSTGNTKFPSAIMLVSVFINIILDPILIFGMFGFPRMELRGAALATVIARSVTLIFSLWLLKSRLDMVTFKFPSLGKMWVNWKKLLYIGIPAGATNVIVPISMGFITSLIASEGHEAVAAFGVATRLEGFLLVVLMALGMSLGPVVGQNWGAKNYDRTLTAANYGSKFAVGWGIFIWIMMRFFSKPLAYLFDQNELVIHLVGVYFLIVAWAYGFRGTLRISTTILSIINRPIDAAMLNFFQAIILLIPMGYLGKYLFGIEGIFGALVLSQLIAGSFAFNWLKRIVEKVINPA
jgi:putative MATE family efflux protein